MTVKRIAGGERPSYDWQYVQRLCHINDVVIENKAKAILVKAAKLHTFLRGTGRRENKCADFAPGRIAPLSRARLCGLHVFAFEHFGQEGCRDLECA